MPHKCLKCSLSRLAIISLLFGTVFYGWPCTLFLSITTFAETSATERGFGSISKLSAGKSITRELSPGEVHSYEVTLATGQYLHVVIEQQVIDTSVMLYGPDNRQLVQLECSDEP